MRNWQFIELDFWLASVIKLFCFINERPQYNCMAFLMFNVHPKLILNGVKHPNPNPNFKLDRVITNLSIRLFHSTYIELVSDLRCIGNSI